MAEATENPSRFFGLSRRRVLTWCLITFVLWGVAAAAILVSARSDAQAGEEALRSVADLGDPTEVDLDAVAAALDDGAPRLASARSKLDSFVLAPLRPLPIIGRQLSSTKAILAVTDDLVSELQPLVESAQQVRNNPNDVDRVAFLNEVADRLGRVEGVIDNADLGPDEGLFGQLAEARTELETRLLDLDEQSGTYRVIAAGVAAFLDDSQYLLLGANNAEMRLGSGMHLSVGRFETAGGEFDLPGLISAEEIAPISGASIVDRDVERNWGFLAVDEDFRSIGYSARFDEHIAPQALELWEAETGEQLDGVLLVDPFVLDALLGVIGAVEVEGESYGQGTVLAYLLDEQYREFIDDEKEGRRDRLSLLATAVVDSFGSSSWDPIDLLAQLEPIARGRHIMAFSTDPTQQAAWETMGVDGAVEGDETGVYLLNTGGSKTDPLIVLNVNVTESIDGDERNLSYQIEITNRAAANLPEYMLGPWEFLGLPEAGTYSGRVAVYAPAGSFDAQFTGGVALDVSGIDGNLLLVSTSPLEVLPGMTRTLTFEYSLPLEVETIDILPSARFPPVNWNWDAPGDDPPPFNDAVPTTRFLAE